MFYRAVAATCPGDDKAYNSNNIYLNSKYITNEIKSSEVLLKQKNEQEGLQFYAVAEGFGASDYTDEASLVAIKKLLSIQKKAEGVEINANYDEAADTVYSYLEDFINDANEAITAKAAELQGGNIYSSIAAVGFYETAAITCNLGNTRIYLFRKGRLSLLTEDHNQAQVMYKNGVIAQDKVASHPKKNKLTQYLGVLPDGKQPEPYYSEVEVKHGDIFVICSSAFCRNVDEESICAMIKESRSLSQIAEKLMHAAAEKGFTEDTSIVVIRADSHEKTAAGEAGARTAAAAGAGAAAGAVGAAAAGKKSAQKASAAGKPAAKAKASQTGMQKFLARVKKILGLDPDSTNEKMWPALLMFGGCILVVIILTVLGIKIYNASKSDTPKSPATNAPTAIIGTPGPGDPTPSVIPTGDASGSPTPTVTPSGSPETGTPGTATPEQPTNEDPTPTQPPTEQPTGNDATPTPTQEPTQPPTATPTPTPTSTPTPTQDITPEPPTEVPPTEVPPTEVPPTEEPTDPPVEPTEPAEPSDNSGE